MTQEELRYLGDDFGKEQEELYCVIISLRKQQEEDRNYRVENDTAILAMSIEYQKAIDKIGELTERNKQLEAALSLTSDKEKLKTKDIYGRSSEQLDSLIGSADVDEEIDEADIEPEVPDAEPEVSDPSPVSDDVSDDNPKKENKHVKRTRKTGSHTGKRTSKIDYSAYPQRSTFELDIEALNAQYGEHNWRIAYWHAHQRLEEPMQEVYTLNTYTPVISVGTEHALVTIPYRTLLLHSCVSESLMADIFYQKFVLRVSTYRIEQSFHDKGVDLSRQNINHWIIRFALNLFGPIYDQLQEYMMEIPYHQCDETTWKVIDDDRKAGSRGYIWAHKTSELYDCDPIVLFSYEPTRKTDHLRRFYQDFKGFITCDAYCSYQILGKESKNVIIICGCLMHMRRRYAESLSLIDTKTLSSEEIEALPETKALRMIGGIYDADEKLKSLSAEERQEQRSSVVKPLMDSYYEYIEAIDCTSPEVSNRLKDAINYSLNQKEYLCRFLEDGNIPIDNGACERNIRPIAASRHSFLFSYSLVGAQALSIMFTIVETARANKVNVYWYLRYILENMPQHMDDTDRSFLKEMMPWSDSYRSYEERQRKELNGYKGVPGPRPELPKTPRKNKRPKKSA